MLDSMVLASMFLWGSSGIFDKKALMHTTPAGQLIAVYCFSPLIAILLAVLCYYNVPDWHLTPHLMVNSFLASLGYIIATLAYLVAMTKGEASLIIGATSSYPLVAQILANLILKEPIIPERMIGCLIIVLGIIAIGSSGFSITKTVKQLFSSIKTEASPDAVKSAADKRSVMICLVGIFIAITGWAVRGIFDKIATDGSHPLEVNLAKYIFDTTLGVLAVLWFYFRKVDLQIKKPSLWPWASGSALCLAGGSATYYVAMAQAQASYVIAITGCYPLVMYLLALVFLKEKFNIMRAVGIGLIAIGGVLTQSTAGG